MPKADKKNKTGKLIALFVLVAAVGLSLFRHWEPGGESWGYWFFARIFGETGKFVILSRSPFYILYLNLFRWIGYPAAVIVECLMTSLIVVTSLVIFLKRYIGLFWAVFAVLLWIPFLQTAEPFVQSLALACSCLAIVARGERPGRFRLSLSYALLISACAMRSPYIIFVVIFVFWDIFRVFHDHKDFKKRLAAFVPGWQNWPLLAVLLLLLWPAFMQSRHSWNNAWFATTKWFPTDGKELADASFIQGYNWKYIYYEYGTYENKDFYFTNQEVFNGANNMLGAIWANPKFVASQVARNTKETFTIAAGLTMLPRFLYQKGRLPDYLYYSLVLFFVIPFALAILYGAFRAAKSKNMILFMAASVCVIGSAVIVIPKGRYMVPVIPIFIMSAFWYGGCICRFISRSKLGLKPRPLKRLNGLIMALVFIFFSSGLGGWADIIKDIGNDIKEGDLQILQGDKNSLKGSFTELEPMIKQCRGVLSFEHKFVGAFSSLSLSKAYDIWEIPPFGDLTNSDYEGLTPERINCVLVSNALVESIGCASNSQIRYQNYILPYVQSLKSKGAQVYDLSGFGQVVILPEKGLRKAEGVL